MAFSWSTKRQMTILGIIALFFGTIVAIIAYPRLNQPPTCIDGKQNGGETGIDCGGSCQLICRAEVSDLVVKWRRSFPVTDTVYNAAAYIENQNSSAAVRRIPYEFRLYDTDRQFIAVRTGETFISASGPTVLFEGGIEVGSRVPVFTDFKFLQDPVWMRTDTIPGKDVMVKGHDGVFTGNDSKPRLSGMITNLSAVHGVGNIDVIGIVYDKNDNALGVSKTVVDGLSPKADANVYFTWPQPFSETPVRNEIMPRFDAFQIR